jgi:hypothetical protein
MKLALTNPNNRRNLQRRSDVPVPSYVPHAERGDGLPHYNHFPDPGMGIFGHSHLELVDVETGCQTLDMLSHIHNDTGIPNE